MAKLTIVMTYIQRQRQLNETLKSFCQYDPSQFNVVIVDDGPGDIVLEDLPFDVEILKFSEKAWRCSCISYNWGFHKAIEYSPDVVIIQNPECLHSGDILSEAMKVTDENYISFACYSLAEGQGPDCEIQNRVAEFNHDSAWYNHSVYRPAGYHFCTAITAANLRKINGFDERFWDGIAYDDDYFVHQIKSLGLRIDIIDNPFVFHQWHDRPYEITTELVEKNFNLFKELRENSEYRAVHLITPDL